HVRETITITSTQKTNGIVQVEELEKKPVRIILSPADIFQLVKIRKQSDIHEGGDDSVLSTQDIFSQPINALSNITKKNMVKVFRKVFLPSNGNGVGGSEMLMEEEEIVKLMKEEEMADLELHVCGNVIDQEDLYSLMKKH
nr:hypothetical protein [Tanacetum cinerariifolium]